MPKVTEAHRDARRAQITDAALRCFAAKGFHRTSMADVIAESGLSAGAIYGHFDSKEELFAAAAGRVLSSRGSELEARRADHGPLAPGEIIAVVIDGMRVEAFEPALMLQVWAEAAVNPDLGEVMRAFLGRVRATLRPHLVAWAEVHPEHAGVDPEGYADRVLPVIMGLVPGFMIQRAILPDFDADGYLAQLPGLLPH